MDHGGTMNIRCLYRRTSYRWTKKDPPWGNGAHQSLLSKYLTLNLLPGLGGPYLLASLLQLTSLAFPSNAMLLWWYNIWSSFFFFFFDNRR